MEIAECLRSMCGAVTGVTQSVTRAGVQDRYIFTQGKSGGQSHRALPPDRNILGRLYARD